MDTYRISPISKCRLIVCINPRMIYETCSKVSGYNDKPSKATIRTLKFNVCGKWLRIVHKH